MARSKNTYTPGDRLEIFHSWNGEWAALYQNGVLVDGSGGDSYHADESIQAMLGVIHVYPENTQKDFLMGGRYYEDIAKTVAEIEAYATDRVSNLKRADELRAEADALVAQANGLAES